MDMVNGLVNKSEKYDENILKPMVERETKQRAANIAAGKPEFAQVQVPGAKPRPIEDYIAEYITMPKLAIQNMSIEDLLAKYSINLGKKEG
jgi:hypothetical protein